MAVRERVRPEAGKLVDMSWDPITRIVGNLGIYTKIAGDNHAVCSCYAQQMAYGVKPPPLGEWIVNLGEAAEYIFDHIIFQDNLVFVDFCEEMVKATTPSVWEKAEKTEARGADLHGYRTIGDIMRSYNPFTGETYKEALHMS